MSSKDILDVILSDDTRFNEFCTNAFNNIDTNRTGTLSVNNWDSLCDQIPILLGYNFPINFDASAFYIYGRGTFDLEFFKMAIKRVLNFLKEN